MAGADDRSHFVFTLDPNDEELARDWTLTPEDLVEVRRCRGGDKRHSFALQLCVLRRYGRFLGDDYSKVPVRIVNHVGRQLHLRPVLMLAPPSRAATDVEHEQRIRDHLGFQPYNDAEHVVLETWLREHAARGMLAEELLVGAEDFLRARRVVAPARYRIERTIATITSRSEEVTLARISERLSSTLREAIDGMLDTDGQHRSAFFQLKQYPPEPKADVIKVYLERAELLRSLGAGRIDLSGVRPEVARHLADLALRYDVDDLRRFAPAKKYALVACFLAERNGSILDQLVEMHHVFLTGQHRHAKRAFEKRYRALRSRHSRDLRLVLDTLEKLIDPASSVGAISEAVDLAEVHVAITGCRELQHITDRGVFDALRARHHLLKRYLPQFLRLPFEGTEGMEPLLGAIAYARQLHAGERELDAEAPTDFATGRWRQSLAGGGVPDLRTWDLALADALRESLRSGDLYLAESRHHQSFWSLVQGTPEEWIERREQAYVELKLPTEAECELDRLRASFDAAADAFANGLGENRFARIENDAIKLSRRGAVGEPPGVKDLRRVIEAHLPRIRIEDLLVEVDGWCGFTRELGPPIGYVPRVATPHATILAALVAHGTNLGIATMAQSTNSISIDMLQHASRWFLRAETLKAADRAIVDYHHRLELSAVWGDTSRASSDGKRWGVQESSLLAGFYPRYFGYYDRAFTLYSHVSDQFSGFGARAISCSPREALYVLDGLLENDTILRPHEHYTDTHGATEHLFGMCHLLGFSFMPRLKDSASVPLYTIDRARSYGRLDPLFSGAIDVEIVREQWDSLVRVASSLKDRKEHAHVLLERLIASERSDRLAKALAMLGRIVRTTFLLRYFHDADVRDRIHLQLNRGEFRHALAQRLFFANQGLFRNGDYAEIMNKVSALSVLSNAVLTWNTVRIAEIMKGLESSTGKLVARDELARVSPLLFEHVIPSGTYHFDRVDEREAAE